MNTWLITDTHFNHDNIASYCKRPEDWTKRVIDNWRKLVQRDDLVIHLGDVIIGKRSRLLPIIGWLPGRKILVRGNHDNESLEWYMNNGFLFACESLVYRKVLFTHHPANELPGNALLNVHGHLHNFGETHPDKDLPTKPFHKLLAIEYTNYEPVLFDKFVGQLPGGMIDLV